MNAFEFAIARKVCQLLEEGKTRPLTRQEERLLLMARATMRKIEEDETPRSPSQAVFPARHQTAPRPTAETPRRC
jgi:hypothetical protein